ncbi:MAG: Glycerol-3-phosphate dehydrogenase, partial [uncultured Friedmanniella sp.]
GGRAAPRRRADPPHPRLDPDPAPRGRVRAAGGRADGRRPGLGRGADGPRGRALPRAGGGRAGVAADARRPHRGRRPPGRPGRAGRRCL